MADKKHVALVSVAYLPPVAFFSVMLHTEELLIEQFETYPKQTFRNRCEILTANGKLSLTIPVSRPRGRHSMTRDVTISNQERWQLNHWRAITSAYQNTPYFLYYQDEIRDYFFRKHENLLQFNLNLIKTIMDQAGISANISLTQEYQHRPEGVYDLRETFHPKKPLNAKIFPSYAQVFSSRYGFHPNLSIIDLLFNMGPDTADYLKSIRILPVI